MLYAIKGSIYKSDTLKRPSKPRRIHRPGAWLLTWNVKLYVLFAGLIGHGVACGEAVLDVQFKASLSERVFPWDTQPGSAGTIAK